MDQFITFRARRDFRSALERTARQRGISVSRLIRETIEVGLHPPGDGERSAGVPMADGV